MTYVNNYEEVIDMPRRDGTGPIGTGSLTGRGFGRCAGKNAVTIGAGLGLGLGLGLARRRRFNGNFGRGFENHQNFSTTQKDLLLEQKSLLQKRLDMIDKQLEG